MKCTYCGKTIPPDSKQCPHCYEEIASAIAPSRGRRHQTVLDHPLPEGGDQEGFGDSTPQNPNPRESVYSTRAESPSPVAGSGKPFVTRDESGSGGGQAADSGGGSGPGELPFRPVLRPPMAVICILDDGEKDGETVRVRSDFVTIGRKEQCDIQIPHDDQISGLHAKVHRRIVEGQFLWFLTDLESTNGTYVQVKSAKLKDGTELLIGSRRYRFRAPKSTAAALRESQIQQGGNKRTISGPAVTAEDILKSEAALVEVSAQGDGQAYLLPDDENKIGSDKSAASVALRRDPMVAPVHARVFIDTDGRWTIENLESDNGIWLRVSESKLTAKSQFQLGEQRFRVEKLT